ncbi:hypothetical protein BJV82DRAFT_268874 [Fennellomyces sp. T-0311]|nr:hypothetical protein BJV82DRAFT_268874 [Fennellomyces sp. T-0311]
MDRSDELLAEHFESGFQSDDVFPSSPTIDATQKRPILDTMFSSESEDSETEEPVLQPLNAKVTRTYGTKQGQKGTGTGASSSSDTTNQIKKEEAQLKVEKYWAPRTHTTRQAPLQRNGAGLRKVQWTKATQRTILQKRLVDRVRHLLITRKRIIRALPLILPWTPMSIRKSASWHSRKSDE